MAVTVCDVGPRDGLQNEERHLDPELRAELVDRLADAVYLLHGEGVETGIDFEALLGVAEWMESVIGRPLPGLLYKAGAFEPVAG